MTAPWTHGWHVAAEAGLLAAARDAARIHAGLDPAGDSAPSGSSPAGAGPMIERLSAALDLSAFEQYLLALAVAAELDPGIVAPAPACCGGISFLGARERRPDDAHWSATSAAAPLRRWRLIHVDELDPLHGRIRVDERVLLALTGTRTIDAVLRTLVRPIGAVEGLTDLPSLREAIETAAARWLNAGASGSAATGPAVLHVLSPDPGIGMAVAGAAAEAIGYVPWLMDGTNLPTASVELDGLAIILDREAILGDSCVVFMESGLEQAAREALRTLLERTSAPVAVVADAPRRTWRRPTGTLVLERLDEDELAHLWVERLRPAGAPERLLLVASGLARDYPLRVERIPEVASVTLAATAAGEELEEAARRTARAVVRGALDGLATRVAIGATWDDLIVPEAQARTLHEIVAHVRQRRTVEGSWGFASRRVDGLAVSALFHGPSGVGKTLAARVIAGELGLDLYRIDLSQVVSKYIGETEKNLRSVFDAAEETGAVLAFDEADALFGKRSEVRDAHDRHANVEVAYLLQRMETYRGVAILTTNLQGNIDSAFLRRLRYAVAFPLPDQTARRALWARAFPPAAPTEGLNLDVLAQLSTNGASIADIALGAAILAADAGRSIGMLHVLRAAQSEYAKLERGISATELEGWPPVRLDEARCQRQRTSRRGVRAGGSA